MPHVSVTRALAEFISYLKLRELPEGVISKAKLLLLDSIACMAGGAKTELGEKILSFSSTYRYPGESTVIGGNWKNPDFMAAFTNSVLSNAMDYDDTGAGGHSGATVIPAALAAAEKLKLDGSSLLISSIIGYEVSERVGSAIQPTWRRYVKVHGKSHQTLGAASACAKAMGLSLEETLNVLGVAAAFSPVPCGGKFGLTERPIAWVKDNVAWASLAGVVSANLVSQGFIGSRSILDGDTGYWRMVCSDRFSYRNILDFKRYWTMRVSIKLYPCCRWLHTTLDALSRLVEEGELTPNRVSKIEVHSIQEFYKGFSDYNPLNMVDAEFSLPYAVIMVLNKVPRARWYSREVLYSSKIREQLKKVRIVPNRRFTREFRAKRRVYYADYIPSRVVVRLRDGSTLEEYQEYASGSPWNPASEEDVKKKAAELLSLLVEENLSKELISMILSVEKADIRELVEAISKHHTV